MNEESAIGEFRVPPIPPWPATTGRNAASTTTWARVDSNRATVAAARNVVARFTVSQVSRVWANVDKGTDGIRIQVIKLDSLFLSPHSLPQLLCFRHWGAYWSRHICGGWRQVQPERLARISPLTGTCSWRHARIRA